MQAQPTAFSQQFRSQFPGIHPANAVMLVGLSGGLDSVVLAFLLKQMGFHTVAAHVNYQLRGQDSEADMMFCRSFCQDLQMPIHIKMMEEQHWPAGNLQEAARAFRYRFFAELQAGLQAENIRKTVWLATAHHMNDQAETVLLQQFRGTGLQGMVGMQPVDNARKLVRPLLCYSKQMLAEWAQQYNLTWREDLSNQKNVYRRNWMRNQLIPFALEKYPHLPETIAQNALRLRGVAHLYQIQLQKSLRTLVRTEKQCQKISIAALTKHAAGFTLLYELLHPLGATAAQTESWWGVLYQPHTHTARLPLPQATVYKNRGELIIDPSLKVQDSLFITTIDTPEKGIYNLPNGILQYHGIKPRPPVLEITNQHLYVSTKKLHWPLVLRSPAAGDYFYPLGLNKKKKIARFMVDQKWNPLQKSAALLMCAQDYVVWLCGHRPDHRFSCAEDEPAHHFTFIETKAG